MFQPICRALSRLEQRQGPCQSMPAEERKGDLEKADQPLILPSDPLHHLQRLMMISRCVPVDACPERPDLPRLPLLVTASSTASQARATITMLNEVVLPSFLPDLSSSVRSKIRLEINKDLVQSPSADRSILKYASAQLLLLSTACLSPLHLHSTPAETVSKG